MATPIFTLNINHKIQPGHVTIGKYDGTHSCLTATTTGDQILIHSPHKRTRSNMGQNDSKESSKELILLSINQSVTAICAGRLNPNKESDILVVGTPTNILAYDVENNMDIFYKEVPDGVSVITIGKLGSINKPLAIVGGNCTIQGFDFEGNDLFWTVTGDNVCSLALLDFDGDGENELVVGSEDYDIRIFKEDSIIGEQTELEAVTVLTSFRGNTFGYGLSNGTVGIYENLQRLWRVKSKSRAVAVYSYDLDGDGVEELITGWSNGKVDARNSRTGEVIFKDNLSHSVAGIVEGDYRLVGKNDLICCSVEGEVRGYNLCKSPGVKHSLRGLGDITIEQETISELFSRKQALLAELRNYEGNAQLHGVGSSESAEAIAQQLQQQAGVIPAKTRLQTAIAINMGNENKSPHVEIALSTNNETIIRAMMVFAEGMFEGETHIVHPKESDVTTKMSVALYPPRDVAVDIHIKALVGYPGSQHFHVFELTRQLPQFSMYAICDEPVCKTSSFVSFNLNERIQRIAMWINQNFHLSNELEVKSELNVSFLSLRDNTKFTITMASEEFVIWTHNMGLAGDLIQSLAAFLNIEDLQVKADFHSEQQQVSALLQQVAALQETRLRLTAETADHSGIVRSLVMRAEDARHLRDIKGMRRWYNEINHLSKDLIQGYNIRCTNHQELLEALKKVNLVIQKASRLRVGKYKTSVINLCRASLKNNNVKSLIKVMKTGEA